jgi:hypothetical protein
MTALVASFGFVPMAIATGAGAEVQRRSPPSSSAASSPRLSSPCLSCLCSTTGFQAKSTPEAKTKNFRIKLLSSTSAKAAATPNTPAPAMSD